jgi:hypothetical protein
MTEGKASKPKREKKGVVISKGPGKLSPQEFRWSLPGDLSEAIKLAAKNNSVDPVEVARHILTKALKVELAAVRRNPKGPGEE